MFKFNELKQLHLEITNNCQASCPMCSRNIHGGVANPLIEITSWSLDQYKSIVNDEVLKQLDSIYFCGNFGDPLLNNDLLGMVGYSSYTNPDIDIRIHTNGSLRSPLWWSKLASLISKNHAIVFALDGLEDTHSKYRIGTNFKRIVDNARSFIAAGGNAEWHFIRFKHNEHQVEQARSLAKELGFSKFVMKDSSRFLVNPQYPVYDSTGNTVDYLEPSQYSTIKFIDKSVIDNYKSIVNSTTIECQAKQNKELYIDAHGQVLPCCWLATAPYVNADIAIRQEILNQYNDLIVTLDKLDAKQYSIKDILEAPAFQTVWQEYWTTKKLITCARSCGVSNSYSMPTEQFVSREDLNDTI